VVPDTRTLRADGSRASWDVPDTMRTMDAATWWAAVGAAGTVVAAWAARQSHDAAVQANAAAESLASIERGRRHDEIAPVFDLKFTETGGDDASLRVTLAGGGLERLDEVTFTILDEAGREHWSGRLPPRVTQEEAEAFVWGPWEFNTNASVQIATNRMSQTRAYSRVTGKNWDLLPLQRTRPGHWMSTYSQQQWQDDYEDHPARLLITCRREGYEPWPLLYEVATGAGPEEKKQASEIKVQSRTFDGGQAGVLTGGHSKPVHMLVVTNASPRPHRRSCGRGPLPSARHARTGGLRLARHRSHGHPAPSGPTSSRHGRPVSSHRPRPRTGRPAP
jgi:hypothetical protein